jgi:hypothetical protein
MRVNGVLGGFSRSFPALAAVLLLVFATGLSSCGGGKKTADQAYCEQVKAMGDFTTALGGVDPTDMKGSAKKLAEITTKLDSIVAVSPAEIKPEWVKVAGTFSKLSVAMKALDGVDLTDPSKIDPKLIATLGELRTSTPDLNAQGETIDIFTKAKCGFAIGK